MVHGTVNFFGKFTFFSSMVDPSMLPSVGISVIGYDVLIATFLGTLEAEVAVNIAIFRHFFSISKKLLKITF